MSSLSVESTQLQRALVPLFSEAGQLSTALDRSTETTRSDEHTASDAVVGGASGGGAVVAPLPSTLEGAQAEIQRLRAENAALSAALKFRL